MLYFLSGISSHIYQKGTRLVFQLSFWKWRTSEGHRQSHTL